MVPPQMHPDLQDAAAVVKTSASSGLTETWGGGGHSNIPVTNKRSVWKEARWALRALKLLLFVTPVVVGSPGVRMVVMPDKKQRNPIPKLKQSLGGPTKSCFLSSPVYLQVVVQFDRFPIKSKWKRRRKNVLSGKLDSGPSRSWSIYPISSSHFYPSINQAPRNQHG